jgi:uncharacterized membrane protein YgcG
MVALLLAGVVLAALPALAGGLSGWVGERVDPPVAVVDPGVDVPAADVPASPGAEAATDPDPPPGGAAGEAGAADPPADDDATDHGDGRDRDDDAGGSGRSGGGDSGGGDSGGGDSGGGGSSGPG